MVPETQRARYRELIEAHVARLRKLFSDNRIDYALMDTGKPLDFALFEYLSSREHLMKRR